MAIYRALVCDKCESETPLERYDDVEDGTPCPCGGTRLDSLVDDSQTDKEDE